MSNYLTKEEVRQWRSSLEKITLEEFAARLGKVVKSEKETNDMIDLVMTKSLNSINEGNLSFTETEKITLINPGRDITEHNVGKIVSATKKRNKK